MEEKKIIFVCTGNTCRSPMAEAIFRSEIRRLKISGASVCSAGIRAGGGNINPNSSTVLSENGLVLENFISRRLDEKMLMEAYAVVCMTDAQRDLLMDLRWNLLRKSGAAEIENNVYAFSDFSGYEIPDPFGRDLDCYRLTYQKIEEGMSALIAKLFPEYLAGNGGEEVGKPTSGSGEKTRAKKTKKAAGTERKSRKTKTEKATAKARTGSRAGSGKTKKTSSVKKK